MTHVEVSKRHSKWRAHANSVDLGVERSIEELEGASSGAGLQELAQDMLRNRQRRACPISVYAVAYDVNRLAYGHIGEERLDIEGRQDSSRVQRPQDVKKFISRVELIFGGNILRNKGIELLSGFISRSRNL